MNQFHVLKLLLIASHLSGYTIPSGAVPIVQETTRKEMAALACPGREPYWCNVVGLHLNSVPDTVFVDAECTSDALCSMQDEDEVLIHELTHWLQWHGGKRGTDCHAHYEKEREAYYVENLFIHYVERNEYKSISFDMRDCL